MTALSSFQTVDVALRRPSLVPTPAAVLLALCNIAAAIVIGRDLVWPEDIVMGGLMISAMLIVIGADLYKGWRCRLVWRRRRVRPSLLGEQDTAILRVGQFHANRLEAEWDVADWMSYFRAHPEDMAVQPGAGEWCQGDFTRLTCRERAIVELAVEQVADRLDAFPGAVLGGREYTLWLMGTALARGLSLQAREDAEAAHG